MNVNEQQKPETSGPQSTRLPIRIYVLLLLGVAGLVGVFWYNGPAYELVHSYGGNLTACFAFYFIFRLAGTRRGWEWWLIILLPLLAATLFEGTNGFFGLMENTYDPLDYLVNALGVGLAFGADRLLVKPDRAG